MLQHRSPATVAIAITAAQANPLRQKADPDSFRTPNGRIKAGSIAIKRMAEIETRLRDFRVRGLGVLPITFSWGTAEGSGRSLRDALDEADRNMYALKRSRAGVSSVEKPPARR